MEALELHPSPDYVSDHIRRTGDYYERPILDEIARRISGGVLIDVGAMIGNHTVFLAKHVPHTAIHAFEPLWANRALLRRNVEPYPTVTVHAVALSDQAGIAKVSAPADNLGHASLGPEGTAVPTARLDAFGLRDVTLLKVDTEGHEAQVLAGARETIERCKPLIVIEDWSGPPSIPGYRVVAEWERAHQTFMLESQP